jgi:hypothetical protein
LGQLGNLFMQKLGGNAGLLLTKVILDPAMVSS